MTSTDDMHQRMHDAQLRESALAAPSQPADPFQVTPTDSDLTHLLKDLVRTARCQSGLEKGELSMLGERAEELLLKYGEPVAQAAAESGREAFEAWFAKEQAGHVYGMALSWKAWQAARRPVRELTDAEIDEVYFKALRSEEPGAAFRLKYARALLSKARNQEP